MKQKPTLLLLLITIICLQSCNTLYNMHNVELEIMIPAKVKFPDGYNKLALKYNKAALPYIPEFSEYYVGDKKFRDTTNTDSIASEVYFQIFWEEMEKANLFDTIIELPKEHLKKEEIADLIPAVSSDYLAQGEDSSVANSNLYVSKNNEEQFINPQVIARGLNVIQDNISFLEQEEIEEIAKTTNADFLFSFDYFSSEDFIYHYHSVGMEYVYTNAMWSIYDLQKKEHIDVEYKTDTITWESEQSTLRGSVKNLPPRKDAILNAADIAATNFAHHLSPHWVKVERMYYRSGHIDLIKTN